MHEASAIARFGEGQMYAALSLRTERWFLCFQPVTPKSLEQPHHYAKGPPLKKRFYND